MRIKDSDRVALEFAADDLERAFKKIIEEHYEFELIGQGIIILQRDAADKFKKDNSFKCKEIEIVSLSDLPRDEANQIRRRHSSGL